MKKNVIMLCTVFFAGAAILFSQDADAILDASRNRIKADTVITRSRMILTEKGGSTTEREIDQFSKDDKDGNARIVIEFRKPKSIAGTRFLTMDRNDGDSDQRIFMPELNKIRRIASSDGSKSFMGTDMSYDDISSTDREVSEDTNTIIGEEKLNGNDCYVIQSVPKDKSYQYSKMIQWIDKSNNVNHKMELYDQKGKLVKIFEVLKLEDRQGRLTPIVSKMTTVNDKTSTTLYVDKILYDSNVPEGVFTSRYLETGKYK